MCSQLKNTLQISIAEIKSIQSLLRKMFPSLPMEYIEDVVSNKYLLMLEKGYDMSSGNLFSLSRFGLYKEMKKSDKLTTYSASYAEVKKEMGEDRYIRLKDGTVEEILEAARDSNKIPKRDLDIFISTSVNGVPVHEVAIAHNLALSPTYRIIKRVKEKIRLIASEIVLEKDAIPTH